MFYNIKNHVVNSYDLVGRKFPVDRQHHDIHDVALHHRFLVGMQNSVLQFIRIGNKPKPLPHKAPIHLWDLSSEPILKSLT